MNNQQPIWRHLLTAFVVALGFAFVFGAMVLWIGTTRHKLFATGQEDVDEWPHFSETGEIIIETRSKHNEATFRTLEGKKAEGPPQRPAPGLSMYPKRQPGAVVPWPLGWYDRLASASDKKKPPSSWYLVRDEKRQIGRAYLVGYSAKTRHPVGYLGRQGFSLSRPPLEDWFVVGADTMPRGSAWIFNGFTWGRAPRHDLYNYNSGYTPEESLIFLIDGDNIVTASIATMEVEHFVQAKSPTTVARYVARKQQDSDLEEDEAEPVYGGKIMVREPTELAIYDAETKQRESYPLPEEVRDKSVTAIPLLNKQMLLVRYEVFWDQGLVAEIFRIDQTGELSEKQSVRLGSRRILSNRELAWRTLAVVPIPGGWLLGGTTWWPFRQVQTYKEPTYAAALQSTWNDGWPPLLVVCALGALLAGIAYRWQRRYARPYTPLWCLFVFIMGIPGLLAYWLHFRPIALGKCTECGRVAPRNRDTCAHCDQPFAAPSLLGTEVFA